MNKQASALNRLHIPYILGNKSQTKSILKGQSLSYAHRGHCTYCIIPQILLYLFALEPGYEYINIMNIKVKTDMFQISLETIYRH